MFRYLYFVFRFCRFFYVRTYVLIQNFCSFVLIHCSYSAIVSKYFFLRTYVLIQNFCSFGLSHCSYSAIVSVVNFHFRTYSRNNSIFRSHNFFVSRYYYSTDLVSHDSINLISFWILVEVYSPFILEMFVLLSFYSFFIMYGYFLTTTRSF